MREVKGWARSLLGWVMTGFFLLEELIVVGSVINIFQTLPRITVLHSKEEK